MKKMPTIFERDWEGDRSRVTKVVNPLCAWVFPDEPDAAGKRLYPHGVGTASRKWDGTAVMVRDKKRFARYDARVRKVTDYPSQEAFLAAKLDGAWKRPLRDLPDGFEPADEPDLNTGHWPGWVPVLEQPQYQWHREAVVRSGNPLVDATYELCGPKINGNPDCFDKHVLILHGEEEHVVLDRSYEGIREYLGTHPMEGLVFRHHDLRMAKIKRSDFGFEWPVKP